MARRFRDAVAALDHLFHTAERNPGQERILAYPDYLGMETEDERQIFHRVVAEAEGAGAVAVKRDGRAGPADIRFVALIDRDRLACFLRRTTALDEADEAVSRLKRELGTLPDWVAAILEEIAAAWAVRREPYPGLVSGEVVAAGKFLRILAAIDRGEHLNGWDMRTFSRRACGDSKAVEAGMARLARALRARFKLPDAAPREVLETLGIEKFPQPILIRGRLRLPDGSEIDARPYVGLPPEWASRFLPVGEAPYVLVIENLASFNRHAREVDDTGLIVFSGGFPSRATLAAIRQLDVALPAYVPFFHWGDTDRHGRLILDHIASAIGRPLTPHLMEGEGVEQEEIDPMRPAPISRTLAGAGTRAQSAD